MIETRLHAQSKASPTLSFTPVRGGVLRRKCVCGAAPGPTDECEACRTKKLQRQPGPSIINHPPPAGSGVPPIVHEVLGSPGQALDETTREFMESRFKHDFGDVRVHTDSRAAQSASAVNALAYTVGNNIAFGASQYAPETREGRWLLAHELDHVRHQHESPKASVDAFPVVTDPAAEHQADRAAESVLNNAGASPITGLATIGLQRTEPSSASPPARKIDYSKAERDNKKLAASIGWGTRLREIAGGAHASWADQWDAGAYAAFADLVYDFQISAGFAGKSVDGILGRNTWYRIAGLGEAMASITSVSQQKSAEVCFEASRERISRGHQMATGKALTFPEGANASTYEIILATRAGKMLDVDLAYRGTGAAGALVYLGLGTFVLEDHIWTGLLVPGAALQVWAHRASYDLLRTGEIEDAGTKKMRPLTGADADFFGTSAVFVRYTDSTFQEVEVRHFGRTEKWPKSDWEVWIAANPNVQ